MSKMIKQIVLFMIFNSILAMNLNICFANNFFKERFRGWHFFEEIKEGNKNNEELLDDTLQITPQEAKEIIDTLSKKIDDAKYIMLARPTPQNVEKFKDAQNELFNKSEEMYNAWEMANFMYPEQVDLINNPSNVHAVKLKREIVYQEKQQKIKDFAVNYSLVLFFSSNCQYSNALSPVLKTFTENYGFDIESVSNDDSKHEFFKTTNNKYLIEKLGIKHFPTVIAIKNDGKDAFELVRGFASGSELEDYAYMATKYVGLRNAN